MKSYADKVAAITGAGSGIGRQLAIQLAQQGCHLSLSDVDESGLAETVAMLGNTVVKVEADTVDVANREQVYRWAEKVIVDHGRVNLIFNNAGVSLTSTVEGLTYEELEWILGINLWGVIHGTKAFLPHIKTSGEGHIVNVSSIFGICAQPTQSAYNISKFAVRGFTESLRQELELAGDGVSATCIHPGGIKTNIARSGRVNASVNLGQDATREQEILATEKMLRTSAEEAAKTILKGVQRNARRVVIGGDAKFMDVVVRLFPGLYQKLFIAAFRRQRR
ncbi:SDR family NAD(P)-dependent oxidoreductase [Litorivivens sp.]|uniref:SDR family NAD(P)-dependent oxidoreductase n=1 Tax=Litorivivens sp. TaxID=2020868 RepID=UPI003565C832